MRWEQFVPRHPLEPLAESIVSAVPSTRRFYEQELAKADNASAPGLFVMTLSSWFDYSCRSRAYDEPLPEDVPRDIPWPAVLQSIEQSWPKMSASQLDEIETHFVEALSLDDERTREEILRQAGPQLRKFMTDFARGRGVAI
jgi:hypothetical protein